jgi:hypothetical protein
MAGARNHHWVPKFYLRGFTKSGSKDAKLWAFDKSSGRSFLTLHRNVGGERDFNRVDVEGHPPDALENALSPFENEAYRAIQRVVSDGSLRDPDARNYLMNLIALLAVRNPRMRKVSDDIYRHTAQAIAALSVENKDRYERTVRQAIKDGVIESAVPFAQMRDFVERQQYSIEVANEAKIRMETKAHEALLPSLARRGWALVMPRGSEDEFATSDHPVILLGRGFGVSGSVVLFPLDRRHAMIGRLDGPDGRGTAGSYKVAKFNAQVVANAQRQVYSSAQHFPQMSWKGVSRPGPFVDPSVPEIPYPRVFVLPDPAGGGRRIIGVSNVTETQDALLRGMTSGPDDAR